MLDAARFSSLSPPESLTSECGSSVFSATPLRLAPWVPSTPAFRPAFRYSSPFILALSDLPMKKSSLLNRKLRGRDGAGVHTLDRDGRRGRDGHNERALAAGRDGVGAGDRDPGPARERYDARSSVEVQNRQRIDHVEQVRDAGRRVDAGRKRAETRLVRRRYRLLDLRDDVNGRIG